jgi:hypothetical protein
MSHKDIRPYRGKRKRIIDALVDPDNIEATDLEICKIAGCSTRYLYGCFREPEFRQAVIDAGTRLYAKHYPQIANSVLKTARSAKKGNDKAQKLIHETLGQTGSRLTQTVNVGVSNEGAQVIEPDDIKDDNEALAIIEQERAQLDAWEQAIKARQAGTNRLPGHGIHPQDKGTDAEEA